jgi:hypothetical protein
LQIDSSAKNTTLGHGFHWVLFQCAPMMIFRSIHVMLEPCSWVSHIFCHKPCFRVAFSRYNDITIYYITYTFYTYIPTRCQFIRINVQTFNLHLVTYENRNQQGCPCALVREWKQHLNNPKHVGVCMHCDPLCLKLVKWQRCFLWSIHPGQLLLKHKITTVQQWWQGTVLEARQMMQLLMDVHIRLLSLPHLGQSNMIY